MTWLGALIIFLTAHRTILSERGAWFGTRPTRWALTRGAAAAGAATLAAALIVGPHLPGAGSAPLVDWRSDGGRRGLSPLVDVRGRLVDLADVEMFTVRSDAAAYWRLVALDQFDGEVWTPTATAGEAEPDPGVSYDQRLVRQEFRLTGLASSWLPAAWRPVDSAGPSRLLHDAAGSLSSEGPAPAGFVYEVHSRLPRPGPEDLAAPERNGTGRPPPGPDARFVDLPAGFPETIGRLATSVTRGAGTPYERALALQDWFRREFTYSLEVEPGHGTDAIKQFLLHGRRGYCEQFAGSYAAMARSLGIPARVAVGFTPGELGEDGQFHVTGRQAHAWPEVYLTGAGWVSFEPTPGRGAIGPGTATPGEDAGIGDERSVRRVLPVAGALAVPAWPAVAAAIRTVLRRRRWRAAAAPGSQVLLAWEEALAALARAGVAKSPSETAQEYARRAGAHLPATALPRLASEATTATFDRREATPAQAGRARRLADQVTTGAWAALPWWRRMLGRLDPRPPAAPAPAPVSGDAG